MNNEQFAAWFEAVFAQSKIELICASERRIAMELSIVERGLREYLPAEADYAAERMADKRAQLRNAHDGAVRRLEAAERIVKNPYAKAHEIAVAKAQAVLSGAELLSNVDFRRIAPVLIAARDLVSCSRAGRLEKPAHSQVFEAALDGLIAKSQALSLAALLPSTPSSMSGECGACPASPSQVKSSAGRAQRLGFSSNFVRQIVQLFSKNAQIVS